MRRLGIRIANVVLFALCCFLLADVVNKISADLLLLPAGEVAPTPPVARELAAHSWEERKPILQRNLFGFQLRGAPAPEPELEEIEKTELPLELLGTIASEDETTARATIWHKTEREHQVLRVGDRLKHHDDVQLARIERRRVVLLNGESPEELRLDDRATSGEVTPKKTSRTKRSRARRRAPRRTSGKPTPPEPGAAELLSQLEALQQEIDRGDLDEEDLAERLRGLDD